VILQVVFGCTMIHDLGWFNFGESLRMIGFEISMKGRIGAKN
jgi:hypothetical protein